MDNINEHDNQRAIKKLQKGIDTSWDLFFYGDKDSNTKPGNMQVYGTIVGQREVLEGRKRLQEQFDNENNQTR